MCRHASPARRGCELIWTQAELGGMLPMRTVGAAPGCLEPPERVIRLRHASQGRPHRPSALITGVITRSSGGAIPAAVMPLTSGPVENFRPGFSLGQKSERNDSRNTGGFRGDACAAVAVGQQQDDTGSTPGVCTPAARPLSRFKRSALLTRQRHSSRASAIVRVTSREGH
jgi:hypothetical protein